MNAILLAALIHLTCIVFTRSAAPEATTVRSYVLELYDGGGKSYQTVKAECESRDSWLVEIKDEEIENAVQRIASSFPIWIGLFYEGGWKWNDGSVLRYKKWRGNAPTPTIYTKCGLRESSGYWRKNDCLSGFRYICQSDINYPGPFFINIKNSGRMDYYTAKASCESDEDWRLVDIKTPVLNNFILEKLNGSGDYCWTGGIDINHPGVFKWSDNTAIAENDYRWWGQEPDNPLNEPNCVAIVGSYKGWVDVTCSVVQPGRAICQNDASTECDEEICSSRGTCTIDDRRYDCTCDPGYFGTKCEKNLIQISADEPTVTGKIGESLQVALTVISFDGNVRISRFVSGSQLDQQDFAIQRAGTSVKVTYSLGIQVENKTYTIAATPSTNRYSHTASTSVIVEVTSRCSTSHCSNGGTCVDKVEPPYYQCQCTVAYAGDHCEERKYLIRGNCKYHVNYENWTVFSDANSTCQDLGGALVMIKSLDLQDVLEEQFIRQYGNSGDAEIWVGGYKRINVWYWMDGTKIPTTGPNQKWQLKTKEFMMLSAWGRTRDNMFWYSKPRTQTVPGYICEFPVSGRDPCGDISCDNGGKCVSVGCQANCDCAPGFDGSRCENDRVKITPLRTSYTVEQGQMVSVMLRIHSNDGRVNVLMYKSGSSSQRLKTGVSDGTLITFTIRPLKDQTPKTTYIFRATPQSSPGTYFKYAFVYIGVEGPPSIPEIYPDTLAIPSAQSQNTIACTATGFPTPTITWKSGDLIVPGDTSLNAYQEKASGKSTLYFSNQAKTEVGEYTCFAENIVGGRNKSTNGTAFVRGKIGLIKSIAKITDSSFQLTNISCTFEGYPNFDIRWKFGSTPNKFESIPSNEDGSIFSIKDEQVDTEFTPLVRKMSTLNITLTEYLGPTIVSCYAGNKYENTTTNKNTAFELNQNLVLEGNRSYRIYTKTEDKRNFSATVSYCEAVDREPIKIYDNSTQLLLTEELSRRSLRSVFIAAQRQLEDEVKLWKWNDGSIFYNETKHGPSMDSASKIVDGQFVAWNQGEPSGIKKNCARLTLENVWAWFGAKCQIKLNPICESHVAGVPKNLMMTVKKCTANLTVTWSTNKPAIGVKHRLEIRKMPVYQSRPEKTKVIIPTNGEEITKSFPNLDLDTEYNVTFIVCPQCPIPFRTSKLISTYAIVPAENRSVETANVARVGKFCMVSWSVVIPKGIIGFKVTAESNLAHSASRNLGGGLEERNTTHLVRLGQFPTIPNRRYTFGVQTLTCRGLGHSVQATGNCVSDSARPPSIPRIYPETLSIPPTLWQNTIACTATGFPTPTITWKSGDLIVPGDTSLNAYQVKLSGKSTLYFSNHAKTEVGYYTCYAENIVGGRSKSTNGTALVRGKLQLCDKTEEHADSSNEKTNFSCSFEGYPDFDIYWKWENDVKMHVILTNDTGSLLEIRSTVDKTFPLVRKTSTLNIRLAEYLGRTSVSCYAGNEYANISGENFAINQNSISRRNEWYRIYYGSHVRGYGDAEKHCQAEGGNLVKIVDPETQAILTEGLTNRSVQDNIFIGARRHIESNTLLWKWYDDTLLYNETKASISGTAGEEYMAWDGGEPNESGHECAVMNRNRQWSWSDNDCNHEHGFICQSPVAGIPRDRCLVVAINHKTANLTLTWKPAEEAIGLKHRIEIMRIAGTKVLVKSDDIIPRNTNPTSLVFPNLDVDAAYNVTITVCPECPLQFATENVISTYMMATAKDPAATKFAIGGRACERLNAVDFQIGNTSRTNVSCTNDGIAMGIIIIIVLGILLFVSVIINAILGLKLRKPQKASAPEEIRPYETTYLAESPYRYDNDETIAQSNENRPENNANVSPHDDPSAYEIMESGIGGTDASGYEVPRRLENEPNNPYEEVERSD